MATDEYLHPDRPPDAFRISRKPVSNPNLRAAAGVDHPSSTLPPHASPSPNLVPAQPPSYTDLYAGQPQSPGPLPRPRSAGPTPSSTPPPASPTPIQKAYGEARHFLGGLIDHPAESNKHFTILRHSSGIVFYRGIGTSVAVSIFSDAPLPPDRTYWLQSKGWTGKTGMRAKSLLHLRDGWVDVTPSVPLMAGQVNPDDERAWQRDIKKFRKKAPSRPRDTHQLRETAVVRIPAEAGDGYFQLVCCQGLKKKVLANSPVFRVLSTSASPSSIRGASLSTLPLEVGAMVAGLYAQTAAQTVVAPVKSAIQSKVNPYRPSWVTQAAAKTAYSTTGIQDRVGEAFNPSPDATRGVQVQEDNNPAESSEPALIAIENGPQDPFPMEFKARAQIGQMTSPVASFDTPRLALSKVPDWVLEQLRGYFFGWARFDVSSGKDVSFGPWCPMILSVQPLDPLQAARVNVAQIAKRVVALRLLGEVPLQTTKLEVRVMGFLRAGIPPPTGSTSQQLAEAQEAAAEAAMLADVYDASIVENTLVHQAWAPDRPSSRELPQPATGWKDRTRAGYSNARAQGQKLVGQVPLHRLGVRSMTDGIREKHVATSGFYIVR
ncbi:hypothetical protein N7474_010311 [Penicillium riverlandense]|uniref:uncharacterized protein n=1 Tax=Penicillium riverlandense TaxID=1903569 RepID=UPI0025483D16|nr:uncharacterized protein N7474_010311 [Penicillium riverlandense]KAJ5806719.1 hypothetical protein N7474_010311 [Penicillium riverlandense]